MTDMLASVVLATAGRLQAVANDGGIVVIKEADLRSALRDSAYPHAAAVAVEVPLQLPHWPRVGCVDVRIGDGSEVMLVECKWCHDSDKLAETLWDTLKLASAAAAGFAGAGFVVAAAADTTWDSAAISPLFEDGQRHLPGLLKRFSAEWSWLYRSVKIARPQRLPAVVATTAFEPASIVCAATEPWTLRAIAVTAGPADLPLDQTGVPLVEEIDAIDPGLEATMLSDAAQERRADMQRRLAATPGLRIFEDRSISDAEKTRRLVEMMNKAEPSSPAWHDAQSYLRSLQMRQNMRDNDD